MSSSPRVVEDNPRSLLARLVLAVVVAGLVTGLAGSWLIASSAGSALRRQIDQQNLDLARSLASRLDDRVGTRITTLKVVATRRELEELGGPAQTELNVVMKEFADLDRIYVYMADGTPIAASSSQGLIDVNGLVRRPELAQQLGEEPATAVIRPSTSPLVELVVPIENPPGTTIGFLVGQMPLDEVASHLTEQQFDPARTAFLVDGSGTILVHPERERVVKQQHFTVPAPVQQSPGSFRATEASVAYRFAAAPTAMVPAQVVVQQRESDALAPVRNATRNLIAILLAVIVVTVIVVSLVGSHLLAPLRPMADAARRIAGGDQSARVPAAGSGEVGRLAVEFNRMSDALEQRIAELKDRKAAERYLREQTNLAETLHRVGTALTAELDLQQVVQAVTDVATELTGAEFGAFFYNVVDGQGESYMLYTIAGAPKEAFAGFPMPRNTEIFGPTFRGQAPVRIDDVTKHPSYGQNPPYSGMPQGHLPVRSYLAVSVKSRTGDVVGGLFFGHSTPGVFTLRDERLVEGVAAHAAIAIDNARLYEAQRSAAETLQRALLPVVLPSIPGYRAAARYLPAEPGVEVGGDWYDVIELPSGQIGLVIGDVAGRGLIAAGTMGQLCHALRAYALEDYSPAAVLTRLNNYAGTLADADQFATVLYAVLDPASSKLRIANAGHLPALLLEDLTARYLEVAAGLPVGALPGQVYQESAVVVSGTFTLLFYTDGLVEDRSLSLSDGLERLRTTAGSAPRGVETLCDQVVGVLTEGRQLQDDIAVLAFGTAGAETA